MLFRQGVSSRYENNYAVQYDIFDTEEMENCKMAQHNVKNDDSSNNYCVSSVCDETSMGVL